MLQSFDRSSDRIQIYSDGGFDGVRGAAGVVPICYQCIRGEWVPVAEGYRGLFMKTARSAFHAELVAADAAIQLAFELGQLCPSFRKSIKRARFY